MSDTRIRKWLRWTILGAVLATAASVPMPTQEAEAAFTRCGTEIFYYSDASLTTIVGATIWLPEACGCAYFTWGTFSPHRVIQDSTC